MSIFIPNKSVLLENPLLLATSQVQSAFGHLTSLLEFNKAVFSDSEINTLKKIHFWE
jgi:hypothetical protein